MSKKLLVRLKNQKIGDVRRELGRAHLIIALLAFVVIALLTQAAAVLTEYQTSLTALAIALLAILSIISLSIACTLFVINRKK